jgi:hypothetical protein
VATTKPFAEFKLHDVTDWDLEFAVGCDQKLKKLAGTG